MLNSGIPTSEGCWGVTGVCRAMSMARGTGEVSWWMRECGWGGEKAGGMARSRRAGENGGKTRLGCVGEISPVIATCWVQF